MDKNILSHFGSHLNVAVIGASGGIGRAFVDTLCTVPHVNTIHAFSRSHVDFQDTRVTCHSIDITSEDSIQHAASILPQEACYDIVIVATGLLHNDTISPEKTIRHVSMPVFQEVFAVNTFAPALIMKHFLPRLHRDKRSVLACLSARVGSISDNGLGGWYAYRASKAALNMIIKNAAIETARKSKAACIIGLHPGTVDTGLSEPFQGNVADGKLFTPTYASTCLLQVINTVTPTQSGAIFAWDGQEIPA